MDEKRLKLLIMRIKIKIRVANLKYMQKHKKNQQITFLLLHYKLDIPNLKQ